MFKKFKFLFIHNNWIYLLPCLILSGISIIALLSIAQSGQITSTSVLGQYKVVASQSTAIILGFICAIFLSFVNFKKITELWPYISIFCWVLVLATFIPGVAYSPGSTTSHSWIALPLGFSFQPTELAKIAFFISLSVHLSHVRATISKAKTLCLLCIHIFLPVVIIHLQGDDGTAAVYLATGLIMLFLAGVNRWIIIGGSIAGVLSLPLIWKFVLSNHQKDRIIGMLYPQKFASTIMYQQIHSQQSFSIGGVWGVGFFQKNYYYVPRAENDFIFSYLGQCLGFIGATHVLLILFGFLFKTLYMSAINENRTAAYFTSCVFASLLFQTCIHIGMNLMLLPVMGLTLPFLSAGGSSVLMIYLSVGLVLSANRSYGKKGLSKIPLHKNH